MESASPYNNPRVSGPKKDSEKRSLAGHVRGSLDLLVVPPDSYNRVLQEALTAAADNYDGVVLLATSRPIAALEAAYDFATLFPAGKLKVVDLVTSLSGRRPQSTPDVSYIESPALLEKAALHVQNKGREFRGRGHCVVVDSLSALTVYNSLIAVVEFTHFLTTKLRTHLVGAIVLTVPDQSPKSLVDSVRPFFDNLSVQT